MGEARYQWRYPEGGGYLARCFDQVSGKEVCRYDLGDPADYHPEYGGISENDMLREKGLDPQEVIDWKTEFLRLRDVLSEIGAAVCTCDPAFSDRGLVDPGCLAGEVGDEAREAIGLEPVCRGRSALRARIDPSRVGG